MDAHSWSTDNSDVVQYRSSVHESDHVFCTLREAARRGSLSSASAAGKRNRSGSKNGGLTSTTSVSVDSVGTNDLLQIGCRKLNFLGKGICA